LVDGAGGERRIEDAQAEHGGVAEPEREPGHEADFRHVDGAEAPGGIDPITDRPAGQDAGAHVVADGIAGEACKRRGPIRDVASPDRAQREQVVERQREVAAGDEQGGERDVAPVRGHQGLDDLAGVDRAQSAIEHDRRDRDDGDAERHPDPVPADPAVAKHRGPMQGIEHSALAIL
jgi:hypothetical protein